MQELTSNQLALLAAVNAYRNARFQLFETDWRKEIIKQKGKKPRWSGWQYGETEFHIPLSLISQRSFGVALTSKDLVIDVDVHDPINANGIHSLCDLSREIGIPLLQSPTFIVFTGGGGYHLYYKKPALLRIPSAIEGYPGLEFKSKGKGVIGCGSKNKEGMPYICLSRKKHTGIQRIPEELGQFLSSRYVDRRSETKAYGGMRDNSGDMLRLQKELDHRYPGISGQGRRKAAYHAALLGHDFGISKEQYTQSYQQWCEQCEPPLSWEESEIILANAYEYAQEPAGHCSVHALLK